MKDMSRRSVASPAALYLEHLAPGSARTVSKLLDNAASALSGVAATWQAFDWRRLKVSDILRLRSELRSRYSVSTTNATLTAVRGVLREACRQGLLPASDYLAAVGVAGPPREPRMEAADLDLWQLTALLEACRRGDDQTSSRDLAMITLLYAAGLTSQELVQLDLADFDVKSSSFTVRRKAGPEQYRLHDGTMQLLKPWLSEREDRAGPLFYAYDRAGFLIDRRLAPQVLHDVLSKRSKQVGLIGVTVSAVRRLAQKQRTLLGLQGRPVRDSQGRILCLPVELSRQ
jgi:integrase